MIIYVYSNLTTKNKPLQKYIAYYLCTAYIHINKQITLNQEYPMHRVVTFRLCDDVA